MATQTSIPTPLDSDNTDYLAVNLQITVFSCRKELQHQWTAREIVFAIRWLLLLVTSGLHNSSSKLLLTVLLWTKRKLRTISQPIVVWSLLYPWKPSAVLLLCCHSSFLSHSGSWSPCWYLLLHCCFPVRWSVIIES